MNGVFLGVLAGLDFGPEVLGLLSLLGAAMLLLLAWGQTSDRQRAARMVCLAPATLPRARFVEVRVHLPELARACGTSRAPPGGLSLPIPAPQSMRPRALN